MKIVNAVKNCGGNAVVKYDAEKDKLVVCKVARERMLPQDLYSKWDDGGNFAAEINAGSDAHAESAVKPVEEVKIAAEGKKTVATNSDDTKGEKDVQSAKKDEQELPNHLFSGPMLEETHSSKDAKWNRKASNDQVRQPIPWTFIIQLLIDPALER